jgi:hypothetical protein
MPRTSICLLPLGPLLRAVDKLAVPLPASVHPANHAPLWEDGFILVVSL